MHLSNRKCFRWIKWKFQNEYVGIWDVGSSTSLIKYKYELWTTSLIKYLLDGNSVNRKLAKWADWMRVSSYLEWEWD